MKISLITLFALFFSLGGFAQKKNIKVQIMHENKVVLDTTLHMTSTEAKEVIESLVEQFSKDPVTIDSKLTHGLYVFNITNDSWKEPSNNEKINKISEEPLAGDKKKETKEDDWSWENDKTAEQAQHSDPVAIDSLWNEFTDELSNNWDELNIEMEVDSLGASFKQLWGELDKVDFSDNPDVQEFKMDVKEFFKDLKKTQFIIIHENDTIEWK